MKACSLAATAAYGRTQLKASLRRLLPGVSAFFAFALPASAQFVAPYCGIQGTLMSGSGLPAKNATLTLVPSQVFFVGGVGTVVSEAQCSTDNSGAVVGTGNPSGPPRVSAQFVGSLPTGNYYVKFTWYDTFGHETQPSVEVAQQLLSVGEIHVLPPIGTGPPNAVGMRVYIGTSPGTETLQGHTSDTTSQFTQAVALVTGATPPISNSTQCRVICNDAGWPTGTGYKPSLVDADGNTLFNYPQMWQFIGPGSTYNLSNGLPYYNGQVTYPVPVLTIPYNHNPQSISGPLSLTNYNLYDVGALGVDTSLPAWGVDVEGAGNNALINAAGGYLINGLGGTAGQAPCSDGTAIDTFCNFLPASTSLFYQTVQANAVDQTQRAKLNFSPRFALTDSSSPSRTTVDLATVGTAGVCAAPATVTFDAYGRETSCTPGTAPAVTIVATASFNSCTLVDDGTGGSGCQTPQSWGTTISGTYHMWCTVTYLASVGCGNLGDCSGIIYNEESHTSTDFTYILNQRLNNGRTNTVPMTCWAAK